MSFSLRFVLLWLNILFDTNGLLPLLLGLQTAGGNPHSDFIEEQEKNCKKKGKETFFLKTRRERK
uniref:Uncharacterized protein n=1 Tax=Arundo donax TaxID=35708 RepID=A0A0A9AHA1_ARUDO